MPDKKDLEWIIAWSKLVRVCQKRQAAIAGELDMNAPAVIMLNDDGVEAIIQANSQIVDLLAENRQLRKAAKKR